MNKGIILALIASVILALFMIVLMLPQKAPSGPAIVCFDADVCVDAEVASDKDSLLRGLMGRESLGTDSGMLFAFPFEGRHGFWMKDTLIPLDMMWIGSSGEIVHIETAMPCEADPCPEYKPPLPALYVLEVNSGYAIEKGIKVGDKAKIRFEDE